MFWILLASNLFVLATCAPLYGDDGPKATMVTTLETHATNDGDAINDGDKEREAGLSIMDEILKEEEEIAKSTRDDLNSRKSQDIATDASPAEESKPIFDTGSLNEYKINDFAYSSSTKAVPTMKMASVGKETLSKQQVDKVNDIKESTLTKAGPSMKVEPTDSKIGEPIFDTASLNEYKINDFAYSSSTKAVPTMKVVPKRKKTLLKQQDDDINDIKESTLTKVGPAMKVEPTDTKIGEPIFETASLNENKINDIVESSSTKQDVPAVTTELTGKNTPLQQRDDKINVIADSSFTKAVPVIKVEATQKTPSKQQVDTEQSKQVDPIPSADRKNVDDQVSKTDTKSCDPVKITLTISVPCTPLQKPADSDSPVKQVSFDGSKSTLTIQIPGEIKLISSDSTTNVPVTPAPSNDKEDEKAKKLPPLTADGLLMKMKGDSAPDKQSLSQSDNTPTTQSDERKKECLPKDNSLAQVDTVGAVYNTATEESLSKDCDENEKSKDEAVDDEADDPEDDEEDAE